ncbi:MAG: hypothetical protein U9N49_05385 [Campylobacterota bacterium]|nr:hypothetical protein [Campylobacterota bacterium]
MVGHAAVVISEYKNDDWRDFVIAAEMDGMFKLSHKYNLNGNNYLGHFRAVSRNYTFEERDLIKEAALEAYKSEPGYEFINLYTYDWDFEHENNIPYSIYVVPTDFRCDGLAEWAIEVATKSANPTESDGFYSYNNNRFMYIHEPIDIIQSPIDAIGTPDAPTLALTDTDINASFAPVSGAWSEALYVLYRSTSPNSSTAEVIYCGKNHFYRDPITDDMEGEYFYYSKIGEITASCSDTDQQF